MHVIRLIVLVCLSALSLCAQEKQTVLYNGNIVTMDPDNPTVGAIAFYEGKVIATGTHRAIRKAVRRKSIWIDLKGRTVFPGLVDSHVHAIKGGERLLTAHLAGEFLSIPELAAFGEEALKTGKGLRDDCLYITGVHSRTWSLIDALDSVFNGSDTFNERPVFLYGTDGHTAWCNDEMLRRAGIDQAHIAARSEEERLFYGIDANGDPNGFLAEAAIDVVDSVLPPGEVSTIEGARSGIRQLNSLGVTAFLDPSAGAFEEGMDNRSLAAYHQLNKEEGLNAHVAATVVADVAADATRQLKDLDDLRRRFHASDLRVIGFKIFADGVLEFPAQTAALSIPYSNSNKKGTLLVDPVRLGQFVQAADRARRVVHIHAIGDRAVTESLNAFRMARKINGASGIRHSITHLQLVHPNDFSRFASLDVLPCMQLLWATADEYAVDLVKPYIDSVLNYYQYPAKTLLESGATLCGASDWPVTSANPFEAMAMAEQRNGTRGVLGPHERISREDMLEAYTINSAKALGMEQEIGTLEVGKYADLVVLDRDITKVDADSLRETLVLCTLFKGEIVHGSID